jgi:hypothetical protein
MVRMREDIEKIVSFFEEIGCPAEMILENKDEDHYK